MLPGSREGGACPWKASISSPSRRRTERKSWFPLTSIKLRNKPTKRGSVMRELLHGLGYARRRRRRSNRRGCRSSNPRIESSKGVFETWRPSAISIAGNVIGYGTLWLGHPVSANGRRGDPRVRHRPGARDRFRPGAAPWRGRLTLTRRRARIRRATRRCSNGRLGDEGPTPNRSLQPPHTPPHSQRPSHQFRPQPTP